MDKRDRDFDRVAYDAVLFWCRHETGGRQRPCMRNGHDGKCVVVDVNRFDNKRLAEGDTWRDVAIQLGVIKED